MFYTMKDILDKINYQQVYEILALNEISGNYSIAYKFSYAGSGNSGYSFGISQFDVSNNLAARNFLLSNGFTKAEIQRLLNLDKNISDLNKKLESISSKIDEFDKLHIIDMCKHVASLKDIPPMSIKTFTHLVDYHNQFNLSKDGKMHNFLKTNKNYLLSIEYYDWKIKNTKWGRENPSDVLRRYKNIEKYFDMNIY